MRDRFRTAAHTARVFHVSKFTVRRRLREHDIHCRRPVKRLHLQQRHMQARLNWTNAHRRWTLRQWEDVIFSDESRFLLERHEGRRRVYRRLGEQLLPNTVSTASDRRGVMVWGAISATGKSQLVIVRVISQHRGTSTTVYVPISYLSSNVTTMQWHFSGTIHDPRRTFNTTYFKQQ